MKKNQGLYTAQVKSQLYGTVEVFLAALKLGLTSFGGPIAHLGYFRREYVQRRKWLDERQRSSKRCNANGANDAN